jgi:hypothetical protein
LISEIPRILNINAQCTGFLSSLKGGREGGVERKSHYVTMKPNKSISMNI